MKSLQELEQIKQKTLDSVSLRKDRAGGIRIVVGMGTCGIAAGARPVLMSFLEEVQKRNLRDVTITQTGCIGVCRLEPMVEVTRPGEEKVTYVKMTAEKAKRVISEHIVNGKIVNEYTIGAAE
ncbi:MAG: (2Fe-2S) ferredoxin domain-containing protein [Caldicoprobacterales bacterium]|jgi:NADP-reducing hydrogenase subunit HndB|nr:(2Fe-2S) ferredoxin domain-containing protein [Clostridiales bacterium]